MFIILVSLVLLFSNFFSEILFKKYINLNNIFKILRGLTFSLQHTKEKHKRNIVNSSFDYVYIYENIKQNYKMFK